MDVQTLPAHDALLESIGDDALTAPEIVARIRKAPVEAMAGYYAPLAVQVHLDQLAAWGLLVVSGEHYSVAKA